MYYFLLRLKGKKKKNQVRSRLLPPQSTLCLPTGWSTWTWREILEHLLSGAWSPYCDALGLQIATPWVYIRSLLKRRQTIPCRTSFPLLRSLRSVYWALLIKLWTALPVPALPVTCPATWGLKNWLGQAQLIHQTWQMCYKLIKTPTTFIHFIHWDKLPFQLMIPYSVFHAVFLWFHLTWNCEIYVNNHCFCWQEWNVCWGALNKRNKYVRFWYLMKKFPFLRKEEFVDKGAIHKSKSMYRSTACLPKCLPTL